MTTAGSHPLDFLTGTWEGSGRGRYPTIDDFGYGEILEISMTPKGFLTHTQRTWDWEDGRPLHAETGYWRAPEPAAAELVAVHPTGIAEVCAGSVDGTIVHVRSVSVAGTPSAKSVTSLERWYEVDGDVLRHRLWMGAVGLDHQHHLEAELHRVG